MKKKLTDMLEKYGATAAVIYFSIFALTWLGFITAIEMGYSPAGTTESAGVWTAAYIATKVTQPIRIGVTLLITPPIGALVGRFRPVPQTLPSKSEGTDTPSV